MTEQEWPPAGWPPTETPLETVRRQLKEIRRRRGISQTALAERVQGLGGTLTETAITRIEGGSRSVSLEEALLLATALGVAPVYLIFPIDFRFVHLHGDTGELASTLLYRWMAGDSPLPDFRTAERGLTSQPPFFIIDRGPMPTSTVEAQGPTAIPRYDPFYFEWQPESARVLRQHPLYQLAASIVESLRGLVAQELRGVPDLPSDRKDLDLLKSRVQAFAAEASAYLEQRMAYLDQRIEELTKASEPEAPEGSDGS